MNGIAATVVKDPAHDVTAQHSPQIPLASPVVSRRSPKPRSAVCHARCFHEPPARQKWALVGRAYGFSFDRLGVATTRPMRRKLIAAENKQYRQ